MSQGAQVHRVALSPTGCVKEAQRLIGDQYWLFVGISTVGILIASIVPFGILAGPMWCGIFLCLLNRARGQQVRFEDLFKGFDYFVESLIATLILMAVMLVIVVPTYLVIFIGMFSIGSSGNDGFTAGLAIFVALLYLLIIVLSLLVTICFCFTFPLIVDRGLKAVPAIKTSIHAAIANFGGLLGLILLCALISFVATLLCYIPVFLVMPILIGAVAVAYRKVFPEVHAAD